MLPDITLRPAVLADMPAVARLAARLLRQHHALDPRRYFLVEPVEPGYQRWLTQELADREAVIVVAERAGAVVGYAYGRLEGRNWMALLDAHGALHDVLVEDEVRGAGVGEALVEAVCARLRELGAPRVVLMTAASNAGAQRLFAKLGFRPTMVEMTRELGE